MIEPRSFLQESAVLAWNEGGEPTNILLGFISESSTFGERRSTFASIQKFCNQHPTHDDIVLLQEEGEKQVLDRSLCHGPHPLFVAGPLGPQALIEGM